MVTYMVFGEDKNAADIGTHRSYSIAAYRGFSNQAVCVVHDVSTDAEEALRIASELNEQRLPPAHMKKAIRHLLE